MNSGESITGERIEAMLGTALGPVAGQFLKDDSVIELMLNPDGRLWVERLGEGRADTGHRINPSDAERVIFIVASSIKAACNSECPILSAELPGSGSRFQGVLPPIVTAPSFVIRKKALQVFTLEDYIHQGSLTLPQAAILRGAIRERKNILIAGGTGSGKTTLANALLHEISNTKDRLVVIEDTIELQPSSEDCICLRSKEAFDMTMLLKATMRLRPDRIIIGEVRGAEALTLLKAWNTGHPGGLATIHADSARKALSRMEQLVEEGGVKASARLIADAVNLIIYIEKTARRREVKELLSVVWDVNDYSLGTMLV